MQTPPDRDNTTLHELIESLQPGWSLDDWLFWPPDTFALTSILLGDSGTHRYVVSPPFGVTDWPSKDWREESNELADSWNQWLVGAASAVDPKLQEHFDILKALATQVYVHDLYSAAKLKFPSEQWDNCRNLIELHAIADQACQGFGIHRTWGDKGPLIHLHLIANLMLATRGSLSRLHKSKGVVVPKMRTPQVGLTLRSLSHHLTFHRSEVDVVWRAVPWLNRDEDAVNILVVPWPDQVDATYFKPVPHLGSSERLGKARYFSYSRAESSPRFNPKMVLELIEEATKDVNRIHLLVFPETALAPLELKALRSALEGHYRTKRDQIPIIVAGIAKLRPSASDTSAGPCGDEAEPQPDFGAIHSNRVTLSVFYSEKWYELSQDKHHRWQLNSDQIRQYKLGGVLTGAKLWWEAINIPKRRLSFFAPNSWLTLCPLICEDLARLEPVSELIRGVGPTLLIAILLDGPQLMKRWPGCYATVLADDPGSSVLTVTSLGLSKRSIRRQSEPGHEGDRSRVVALWKDQNTGWHEIELPKHKQGVVLTISATWREELSSDGRGDNENAAVLELQGYFGVGRKQNRGTTEPTPDTEARAESVADSQSSQRTDPTPNVDTDNALDLIELTLWTYFVNAALDTADSDALTTAFIAWLRGHQPNRAAGLPLGRLGRLAPLIGRGLRAYEQDILGCPADQPAVPSPELMYAVGVVSALIANVNRDFREHLDSSGSQESSADPRIWQGLEHWQALVTAAARRLEELQTLLHAGRDAEIAADAPKNVHDPERIEFAAPPSILWAVHHRLTHRRRSGDLTPRGARLLSQIEDVLDRYKLPETDIAIFQERRRA